MEHFFSPNSNRDLRSDAHQSQIIGGDADVYHTQIIGGYSQIIGGYIPPSPPGFGTPAQTTNLVSVNQIHLRGFRTRVLGTLFHKRNNDNMTMNAFEPSRRVSSLLKGLIRRQRSILFFSQKNRNWNRAPLTVSMCLPVRYCYLKLSAHN